VNAALVYLWLALSKRKLLRFGNALRRPTTLIGFLAVVVLVGFMFSFRRHEVVGHLVEPRILGGCAFLMIFASLFKGFLQRGLVFDPPDIDFLFTSPFTQREIIFYRLFSQYTFAVVQGAVFMALFGSHFRFPVFVGLCVVLLQIVCFHLATAAALFGGALSAATHQRLRWMMLAVFFLLVALYLRGPWELKLVPGFFSTAAAGILFYPAALPADVANAAIFHRWGLVFAGSPAFSLQPLREPMLYLAGFVAGALGSLWLLLRLKGDVFEPSLATSGREAERRLRLSQGRQVVQTPSGQQRSARLPRWRFLGGVGAIAWKNLIVARRSKRELLWVSGFAFIYTGFTLALLYLYHHFVKKAGVDVPVREMEGFHLGVALFLAGLTFFLQRMVPFDLRRDGHHLAGFRTLPVSPLGMALAELSVPTFCCLALQAPCILALLWYGRFSWLTMLLLVLAFPAVVLALNSVWNLHYLIAAAKRAGGENVTAVGTLMIVALSFLIFYPAGWTMLWLGHHLGENAGLQVPLAAGVTVQLLIDGLIILVLARLLQRFEVSRDVA